MRVVRGLFASLGTSALLITAVAASLLSFSVVFAVGGFDDAQGAGARKALVVDVPPRVASKLGTDVAPTSGVLVANRVPARSAGQARLSARSARSGQEAAASSAATSSQIGLAGGQAAGGGTSNAPPAPPPPPPTHAAAAPNLGDSVQALGDGLASTLQQTGSTLGKVVAPLGPQVSVAVQQIVNLVAALVQQATDGLGALLGGKPGK